MFASSRRIRRRLAALGLGLASLVAGSPQSLAGDKTWDNGAGTFTWNTTDLNWTGTAWNNLAGDGAIFTGAGAGTISVPAGISLDSMNFAAGGYTFNGAGPFTLVNGSSSLTTGVFNVDSGTVTMNVPIASSVTAFQKIGGGVLELSQPLNITASFPVSGNGLTNTLFANVIVGPAGSGFSPVGGTLRVLNGGVLSATTSVALGSGGILDIGSNTVNTGGLTFLNQNNPGPPLPYPGSYGVVGTGTLRVNGEINVVGVTGGNFGNAIDCGLDLGGGTQVIRVAANGSFAQSGALMITGPISNGSLLKTIGYNEFGVFTAADGLGLLGNNTYTGATIINGGTVGFSTTTGTNASTSLKVVNGILSVQGADGSYGSANSIQVQSGGSLLLDNNAAFGFAGVSPVVPAANNGNRISDAAAITLRDGNLTYRGLSAAASSETYGSMNVAGGHNVVTIAPTGAGGTAALNATGNLTMDPRSTLQISASSTVLGTTGFVRFGGTVPAAVGGIIPRIVSTSDFVTYDATNGFTPLPAASYATSYTAGANVALSAAATSGSVAINAVKTTASLTTTIGAGNTLSVGTGMMFAASGTHTIAAGGTLDFGNNPGVFIGSHTVNSAVTGSQGLLHASGSLTLAGDLSGLTGTLSNLGTGTLSLNTNTFTGPIEVRRGRLDFNVATLSGAAPITLGVAANDQNLLPANPTLSLQPAGAGAVLSRPIIVDNGATNAGGAPLLRFGLLPLLQPLSNSTGSQTVNSDITLNTSLNFQGGGASTSSTGATTFGGNITGAGTFILANGRTNFTGNISNAGGLLMGSGGFTSIANFQGTVSGNVPLVQNGGSDTRTGFSYTTQNNIGTGPITVQNAVAPFAPTITALGSNSISNNVVLNGDVNASVGTGLTATWAGAVTGNFGGLAKVGDGTLVLSNSGNTYVGNTLVSAGVLKLDGSGSFHRSPTITVGATLGPILDVSSVTGGDNYDPSLVPGGSFALAFGQQLMGSGTVDGDAAIRSGATLAPGNSVGTLNFGADLAIAGTLEVEATSPSSVDLVNLTGSGDLTLLGTSVLALAPGNTYDNATPLTIVQLGTGTIAGTFGSVVNLPSGYFVQYSASSIQLTPVPEPGSLALGGMAVAAGWGLWRRRRQTPGSGSAE